MKFKSITIEIFFGFIILLIVFVSKYIVDTNNKNNDIKKYNVTVLENKNEISSILIKDDKAYLGTNKGLHIYNVNTLKLINVIDDINMIYASSIISDNDDGIWIGHETGLTYISNSVRHDFLAPIIPSGRVNVVRFINDKIYCGTYNGAAVLEKNKDNKWIVSKILNKNSGLLSDSVNVILPFDNGIMFGSYLDVNGGITFEYSDGSKQYYTVDTGLPHSYITSAIIYDTNTILVGSGYMYEGGLIEFIKDNNNRYIIKKVYTKSDDLPGEKVRFLFKDDNTLWITTENDGILVRDLNASINYYLNIENNLSDNEIVSLTKNNKYYWLGSKFGLNLIPIEEILGGSND